MTIPGFEFSEDSSVEMWSARRLPRLHAMVRFECRHAAHDVVDALAPHEPPKLEHGELVVGPGHVLARFGAIHGRELLGIETAGPHGDAGGIGLIVLDEVGLVGGTFGDQAIGAAHQFVLDGEAFVGKAVACALMQAAHAAQ